MLTSYYTLSRLATTLGARIRGWTIADLFTQEKDELVVAFADHAESLIISCRPNLQTLYLHPTFQRAKRNSTGVMRAAAGSSIQSVSLVSGNRIVRLALEGGSTLLAVLFGPHANVLLSDDAGSVTDLFKRGDPVPESRIAPAEAELVFDVVQLRETLAQNSAKQLAAALRAAVPTFGGILAQEAVARAGLSPATRCGDLSEEQREEFLAAVRGVFSHLLDPVPRIYRRKDASTEIFSLIPLRIADGYSEEIFEDVHEAVRIFVGRRQSATTRDSEIHAIASTLRRQTAKARRSLEAMNGEAADHTRADEYERYGKLLMAHLGEAAKGSASVTLSDADQQVTIPMDGRLTSVRNAQRYFEKAKHARAAAGEARIRREELERFAGGGERLLALLEGVHSREELKAYMREHETELQRLGIGPAGKASEPSPFRVFTVDGGFEVWAGKSSTNNDLLTLRYAKPNDLWFHARGSSGSHVVLRTGTGKGEPGKRAREQAAAIAAYYSKMRNAKMVPVAMTERKYVRKPKGASPGTVVLEREKVLFAEPALPSAPQENGDAHEQDHHRSTERTRKP